MFKDFAPPKGFCFIWICFFTSVIELSIFLSSHKDTWKLSLQANVQIICYSYGAESGNASQLVACILVYGETSD